METRMEGREGDSSHSVDFALLIRVYTTLEKLSGKLSNPPF